MTRGVRSHHGTRCRQISNAHRPRDRELVVRDLRVVQRCSSAKRCGVGLRLARLWRGPSRRHQLALVLGGGGAYSSRARRNVFLHSCVENHHSRCNSRESNSNRVGWHLGVVSSRGPVLGCLLGHFLCSRSGWPSSIPHLNPSSAVALRCARQVMTPNKPFSRSPEDGLRLNGGIRRHNHALGEDWADFSCERGWINGFSGGQLAEIAMSLNAVLLEELLWVTGTTSTWFKTSLGIRVI